MLFNHLITDFINGIEFSCTDIQKNDLIFFKESLAFLYLEE